MQLRTATPDEPYFISALAEYTNILGDIKHYMIFLFIFKTLDLNCKLDCPFRALHQS